MNGAQDELLLGRPSPPRRWRRLDQARELAPGVLLCAVIGLASAFLEMRWGGPRVLYALLIGMAFHEFSAAPRQRPGVDFGAQTLLRLGIGMLGARITLHDVAVLGWPTVALVVLAVVSTMAAVAWFARLAGMPWRIGLIAGGATAICGASAALAIAASLPRHPAQDPLGEHRTLAIVVCATTLSTLAMLGYPLVCAWLALPPDIAGLALGGSIHDVAQVAVAGYAMGPRVGDTAIVVKLMRVAMLSVVVVVLSAGARWHARGSQAGPSVAHQAPALMPWFMRLFVLLAVLQSMHCLPTMLGGALSDLSQACLAVAAAALGMRSSVGLLRQAGWQVLLPMTLGSLWLAAAVLGGGLWLHPR